MASLSYDQRTSRAVLGCIAVFMLPFLAAGVVTIGVGVREYSHGGATQQWLIPILAGGAFAAFALGFVSLPFYGMRRARADAAASFSTFVFMTSSIFSPRMTGCAAPAFVPGAIAAMSADSRMTKPADAA